MAFSCAPTLVTDPDDPIRLRLNKVAGGTMGVAQADEQIVQTLFERCHASRKLIHPDALGFDPSNRDKTGGQAHEVPLLGEDMSWLGWSWAAVQTAMCVEA